MIPQLSSGRGAAEGEPGLAVHPVEGATQLAGHGCPLLRREAAALGQVFAAAHADPETAVGKAIARFGAAEMADEVALRDMTHDADMRVRRLEGTVAVVAAKIAAVPGAAEQRRELAVPLAEHMEQGGELLREQEETAIGGRLLIAQSMDDAVGCGAGGGDAVLGPETVGFGEEAEELAPACSFAGRARFADQYDEEIEAVTGGSHDAVRRGAGEVAKGGQELQENGSGIGFGMRREGSDGEAGKAV